MSKQESQKRAVKISRSRSLMRTRKSVISQKRQPIPQAIVSTEIKCIGTVREYEGKRYLSCPVDCPKHSTFGENRAFSRPKPESEQQRNRSYSGKVYS